MAGGPFEYSSVIQMSDWLHKVLVNPAPIGRSELADLFARLREWGVGPSKIHR